MPFSLLKILIAVLISMLQRIAFARLAGSACLMATNMGFDYVNVNRIRVRSGSNHMFAS